MGQRGPIAQVRQLPGTTPNRKAPRRVTLAPAAPEPPADLCAEGKAQWRRVVAELNGKGLLAKIDRAVLTVHCDAWAKHREARRILDSEGLTATGQRGEVKGHPAWAICAQAAAIVERTAKELFASPNARLRSQLPEGADDDEAEGTGILD